MQKKTVYVGMYDTIADWEFGYAVAHINKAQWQKEPGRYDLQTVGVTTDAITTMGNVRVVPDVALEDMDVGNAAMLVLSGAETWDVDAERLSAFTQKAQQFVDAGVPVAAICGATSGIAAAGLLEDRLHTSGAVQYLEASGYGGSKNYVETDAVFDQGVVTAGPTDAEAFAREIFRALDLYDEETLDAWWRLFGLSDASAFYVLASK